MSDSDDRKIPGPALDLSFAGLLPFFALAPGAVVLVGDWAVFAQKGLVAYGALILSFMGGCRWGFAAAGLGDGPAFAR